MLFRRRPRWVGPVVFGVLAADDDSLFVPVHAGADLGGGVAEGEGAAAAVGLVGLGAVEEEVGVEGGLAGGEDVVDGGAVLFCVLDGLVEGVVFLGGAGAPGEVAVVVGASQKAHAGVFDVGIVDGEPAGDSFARGKRPVAGVLMPRDAFAVAGEFAKEMGAPTDDVGPEEVADAGNDAGVSEEVVDAAMLEMGGADGVAVAAGSEGLFEEAIEVCTVACNFGVVENIDGSDVAFGVKVVDLFAAERGGLGDRAGVETKVPLDTLKVSLVRGGFESGDAELSIFEGQFSRNYQGSIFNQLTNDN